MFTITDLKPQVKNPKRVSVYLDGEFYCGLDLLTAVKYRLKVGEKVEKEYLITVQREAELAIATDVALKLLGVAVKTEKQIKDKLKQKGFLDEIIVEVIEKLKDYGFINDSDYAKRYLNTYSKTKGNNLLKLELIKKGVNKSVIEETLKDNSNEYSSCLNVGLKYMKSKEKSKENMLKCYKYLLSKGFSYEDSKEVASKLNEIDED